jgi:DNA-binding NtrC family response regulator
MSAWPSASGKVLIVTNDEPLFAATQSLLQPHVALIHAEPQPKKIPAQMTAHFYDVVLLDVNFLMPAAASDSSPLQTILAVDPTAVVILMAAPDQLNDALSGIEQGAVDFILKPWPQERLLATVRMALALRRTREEVKRLKTQQLPLPHSSNTHLDTTNLFELERRIIERALQRNNGNVKRTATELGLTRTSLYRRLDKYGL